MLYLNRKPGDAVIINQTIEVKVIDVRGKTVKLGFAFPPEASVLRAEIVDQVKEANQQAVDTAGAIGSLGKQNQSGEKGSSLKTKQTL
ncbi:MAG: carbon storage regulator [Geminicoccales bacterium]